MPSCLHCFLGILRLRKYCWLNQNLALTWLNERVSCIFISGITLFNMVNTWKKLHWFWDKHSHWSNSENHVELWRTCDDAREVAYRQLSWNLILLKIFLLLFALHSSHECQFVTRRERTLKNLKKSKNIHFLSGACLPQRILETRIVMKMIWRIKMKAKARQMEDTRENIQMTKTQREFVGTATLAMAKSSW